MVRAYRMGAGAGGGGGAFVPGPLLSGVGGNQNDTNGPVGPTKGDLVYGSATPLWDRLPAGGIQFYVLQTRDVSGNAPNWAFLTGDNFGTSATPHLFLATLNAAGTAAPSFRTIADPGDLPFAGAIVPLTPGATIAVNAALFGRNGVGRVTMAAAGQFLNPTNPDDNQIITIEILSTATRALTYDSAYAATADTPLPTASTGSSKYDWMAFRYQATASKWFIQAKNFGG